MLNLTNNSKLTGHAKALRKNMTKEERHLWYDFLVNLPITVNRQKVIGKYIVDFYVASSKLVIELDGSQHYEDEHLTKDSTRNNYLTGRGLKILRYSNLDINQNFKAVCQDILNQLDTSSTASGPPSPQGEG